MRIFDRRAELLILNRTQFGYHLDTYYYCKCAADKLHITYVGFDTGKPRLHVDGVRVVYVPYQGRKLRRYLRLLGTFLREMRRCKGAVFVAYFPGCSVLRYAGPAARMVIDFRTGSIRENPWGRRWENRLMRWEAALFKNICAISPSLAERLRLPSTRTHIVPLGAEPMRVQPKRFDRLDLLYVGTFDGRRLEDTLAGFEHFLRDGGRQVDLTYTIVGDGGNGTLEHLRHLVRQKGLDGLVRLPGYVHKTQLQDTFDRCNVGVSYVPINDIYDCQPATKTFEYIFAGMPVIATATTENRKIVNKLNGVLIPDTAEGFYRGLKEVYARRHEFDSDAVRRCCPESAWDRIVGLNLVPYIRRVCRCEPQ